jgi:hypothetical protein
VEVGTTDVGGGAGLPGKSGDRILGVVEVGLCWGGEEGPSRGVDRAGGPLSTLLAVGSNVGWN